MRILYQESIVWRRALSVNEITQWNYGKGALTNIFLEFVLMYLNNFIAFDKERVHNAVEIDIFGLRKTC